MLNRTQAPSHYLLEDFPLKKAQTSYLDNGIPIHIIDVGDQPMLQMQFIFFSGRKYEWTKGQALFTKKMLTEGTKQLSYREIYEQFDQHGAFWNITAGNELFTFEIHTLSKYVQKMIELFRTLVLESIFLPERLSYCQNITLLRRKVHLEKTSYIASQKFQNLLFGENHPYGYTLDEEIISKIERESLFDFYQKNINAAYFEIILAGKIESSHIKKFNDVLSCISINRNSEMLTPDFYSVPGYCFVQKKKAVQSSLIIGRILPFRAGDSDFLPFLILNKILGGYFGSRLMQTIREEKGYTYGIHSSLSFLKENSYWSIQADIKKGKVQETLCEIKRELENLKNILVHEQELYLVKNYTASAYLRSITTPMAIASYFKNLSFFCLPKDYYDTFISKIYSVTDRQIQEVALKYLDFESMVQVVAGHD